MGRRIVASAIAAALIALPVLPATAAEVTRESYKVEVEPICQANTEANQQILKGVRQKVRAGKLDAAARQFRGAARALRKTVRQLKAVPQPPADRARLAKWIGLVETEADLFDGTAAKLAADDRIGAQRMVVRLTRNANIANNQVLVFEFEYCRLEPSKFT